ncbi:hypothetical protein FNV43_RR17445 [Rhamnella rubrinervis]|uniref:rhamnogalacturonan endolyase n=1 Tax=Rhamnella rubrinervis TaxID=2594499 RepID=A0A8K0E4A8_9ROSA|nr:hypothetical protein FNV43_RR17445 [Rhamnella rubrinervis]
MEKNGKQMQCRWVIRLSAMVVVVVLFVIAGSSEKAPVRRVLRSISRRELKSSRGIQLSRGQVAMDNGLVRVIFSNPGGDVIGIKYNGIDNLLAINNEESNRGYWDVVWNKPEQKSITIDKLQGTRFKIIKNDQNQMEISFTKTWSISKNGSGMAPLNVDKRYVMLGGYSGFYAYAIFERLEGWPAVEMDQIRFVYKLRQDKFQFMSVSDDRQRVMPTLDDRDKGQPLAYPEAVLLTNPSNSQLRGEVDDKYQYSSESKDNQVHGWISSNPPVGFWIITPSNEFHTAGPTKQDLTSHAGPIALSMFVSTHYAGRDLGMEFKDGEPWKKVFGPVSIYLNTLSANDDNTLSLWNNAKQQMQQEVEKWPYNFPQSVDFPYADQRGSLASQLLIRDRYIHKKLIWGGYAYVGLAAPGDVGSWQKESKGYQFWTKADKRGYFSIRNVRPGNYSLYAWVPGVIGDYKYDGIITIEPGSNMTLNRLVYEPPRNGPTLWEIGEPDRSAAEFYIPDPYPTLMNELYNNHPDKFRQYGLWERYADLYPNKDLSYTVGVDDFRKDWFFAHVTRNGANGTYDSTTWQVIFKLDNLREPGNYTLQLALASATDSELQVRFNDGTANPSHFTTGLIGKDNAIARHGIHGLYWLYTINVPSSLLLRGDNTVYLTQSRSVNPFQGVMYDYIRLEGPPQT